MNIIFICTKNQWRSLTAEHLFKNRPGLSVRSAGTASNARKKVTASDMSWAEIIFVMERKHQQILEKKYSIQMSEKQVVCLNIPDEYQYMDEELIRALEDGVSEYLS